MEAYSSIMHPTIEVEFFLKIRPTLLKMLQKQYMFLV